MCVNDKRVFAMALVLVALMSIFVPVASAGSQDWYLCSDLTLDTTAPVGETRYNLDPTVVKEWDAGAAECDLTMGVGTWSLHLEYYAPVGGMMYVQVYNRDTNTVLASQGGVQIYSGNKVLDLDMAATSVDFSAGDNLVLRLSHWTPTGGGTHQLEIKCGSGLSTLTSPTTDPGYPVPELSSLVLFSVGLLALAGYVVYRRRDR